MFENDLHELALGFLSVARKRQSDLIPQSPIVWRVATEEDDESSGKILVI